MQAAYTYVTNTMLKVKVLYFISSQFLEVVYLFVSFVYLISYLFIVLSISSCIYFMYSFAHLFIPSSSNLCNNVLFYICFV
jgi:hypothetical protein